MTKVLGLDGSRILGTTCDNCKTYPFWMRYESFLRREALFDNKDLYSIPLDRLDPDGKTVSAFVSTAMPTAKMVRFGKVVLHLPALNA